MTKLKQVCNHPAQLLRDGSRLAGRSGKLARLEEILEEVLAAGEKALLFTQYAEFGGMLRAHLAARFGREVAFLHGGVPKADRDAMVDAVPVGRAVVAVAVRALAQGRRHRATSPRPTTSSTSTGGGTRRSRTRPPTGPSASASAATCRSASSSAPARVEEKISAMIQEKRGLAAKIVGTGEAWLTELSTSELRELFALEAGAVVE